VAENDPVLARMMAKVAAWQAAVDSYRAAMALEQGDGESSIGNNRATPIELPVNAFRGVSITDAVKLYLQSVRRKQSVQEIAEGLKAGGIESTAKDFGPSLRGILHFGSRTDGISLRRTLRPLGIGLRMPPQLGPGGPPRRAGRQRLRRRRARPTA
jgi:hypothetical protein